MRLLKQRLRSLEVEAAKTVRSEVWHQLLWDVGQPWADALADYGEKRIKPGDNVLLIAFIDAAEGRPVHDPIRERDQPIADAWLQSVEDAACAH